MWNDTYLTHHPMRHVNGGWVPDPFPNGAGRAQPFLGSRQSLSSVMRDPGRAAVSGEKERWSPARRVSLFLFVATASLVALTQTNLSRVAELLS